MWSTPSLPLIPGPLWPGVAVPDWALSTSQIELFECVPANYLCQIELLEIELFDHLTIGKEMTDD